jgi:ketosteroid isomerase-like protein
MKSTIVAVLLLLITGTAQARDNVRSDIDAANQKFGAAYAKGDAAAIAQLYTPHATVFPPGADMVRGREGIQKVWAGAIQSGLKINGLQTISVEQYGSAAREIGRFTAEAPNAQKQMVKIDGKYVVVWKRLNGIWMLDSDIWNLNQ